MSWDHLSEGLQRFSQFFTAPLLTESSMYREMRAVDSEHKKNLQSDDWRLFQLLKYSSNSSVCCRGARAGGMCFA